jgi:hypothetical protein
MNSSIIKTTMAAMSIGFICLAALSSALAQARMLQGQSPVLVLTNPAPALSETFGQAVGSVGDRLLIANPRDFDDAGTVTLYSSTGVLIRTFSNPSRANGEFFGLAIAALGADKILVGAPLSSPPPAGRPGAAYLFHTNGTLLRTFRRPIPQASAAFGFGVLALGQDRVLIGAPNDSLAAPGGGAVYLFGTNGTLLATITNRAPAANQAFGTSLAALGTDRLLVGAPGGSADFPGTACLITTDGTLLQRFNDPNGLVGSQFGRSIAVMGDNRVIIGAPQANIEAPFAGAANIFNTNGLIVAPLFNPEPDFLDQFGTALAVVDGDKVLVGSEDQRSATAGGSAYLFASDGTLLMTMNQPVSSFSRLGGAVADLGEGRVLVGASGLDLVGAAYVYQLMPSLQIASVQGDKLSVSWPSAWSGWMLQQSMTLDPPEWATISESVTDDGAIRTILVDPSERNRFHRLFKP